MALVFASLAFYSYFMTEISVTGSYRAQWGEGAIWSQGALYYVDIEKHLVIRFDPITGEETFWNVGQRVGTVVPRANGGLLCAGDHGFFFLDPRNGEVTPIADPEPEKTNNRFNDGKCSPDGAFFAGTISLAKQAGDASLYRLGADLSVKKAYGPVTNSNGIVWSSDARTVYYIDTPRREILSFDYLNGALCHERSVVSTANIDASPDGMCIDENDHLWVAFCHGACVVNYDPISGKELRRVVLPCLETTSCAFGGKDLAELYVTTGIHKSVEEEHGGRLFVIRGLGVKGQPSHAFAG
ncbi:MAG: SMP-30/gluconolactonase/LRE family protein [Akkermansiaceae bacterium]|jgi:sugar lactone lactonase YvrE